ncbi:hypothetical protein GW846_06620 [Candidatus Gracilibacteria bacterium]|nr:hypothetical protein [Candidatus Gracilibacteria bacterium]
MPSKNIVKIYIKDGIYHVYNRGVEERVVFLDEQDYKVFLYYLKSYLSPPELIKNLPNLPTGLKRNIPKISLYKEIKLFCYCLMPNHFHLMIKQLTDRAIVEFMRRLTNAYTRYFNEKYKRVGGLFQGTYKAVLVKKEDYFLHLSRYIHINILKLSQNCKDKFKKLREYPYSSYQDYLGKKNTCWIYKDEMVEYFKDKKSYQDFVEDYAVDSEQILGDLILE